MFIGIDVGTSEIKAILLNDRQEVVASSGVRLALSRPAPGHCEEDPQEWWDATFQALRALQEAAPQAYLSTTAIGLSGQMHGAVLLDEEDAVIRPAILWNDTRSHRECIDLMQAEPELGVKLPERLRCLVLQHPSFCGCSAMSLKSSLA